MVQMRNQVEFVELLPSQRIRCILHKSLWFQISNQHSTMKRNKIEEREKGKEKENKGKDNDIYIEREERENK